MKNKDRIEEQLGKKFERLMKKPQDSYQTSERKNDTIRLNRIIAKLEQHKQTKKQERERFEEMVDEVCSYWQHRIDNLKEKETFDEKSHNRQQNLIQNIEKQIKQRLKEQEKE